MKVLWVTNTILPEFAEAMKIEHKPFEGWLFQFANKLKQNESVELHIATAREKLGTFNYKTKDIEYTLLESKTGKGSYDKGLEKQWINFIKEVKPDVVHLHGSENASALALIKTHPKLKYVLSIQGIIGVIARYYKAGISNTDIIKNLTLRSILKNDHILAEEKSFYKRGNKIEKEYFKLVNHFIGRTDWDKAHTRALNPKSTYHFCNEMLRESFYTKDQWTIENANKHSIFVSQGNYPIKGLHQALKAVALLRNEFPDIKLYFAGSDILLNKSGIKGKLKLKNYGKFLKKTIKQLNLSDNIEYMGVLNEAEMYTAYLKAHAFVCPSSIENSPNSLAEAQILGVPSIGTFAGGIPNMISHHETGFLYRFEEVEQLAENIRLIFNDTNLALNLSQKGREAALERHDREQIVTNTINIYKTIIS